MVMYQMGYGPMRQVPCSPGGKHEFSGFWKRTNRVGWRSHKCSKCGHTVDVVPSKSQPWRGRRPRREK